MELPTGLMWWLEWLAGTALAVQVRESVWLYPLIETLHILGFTVLVGAAVMFDLRLLGRSRGLSVRKLEAHLIRWARRAALVVVPTGVLLFIPRPLEIAGNPFFQWKLVLLAIAALNALLFHWRTFPGVAQWDEAVTTPLAARFAAAASLVLWTAVLTCGRLIAYY
ncbi:MAG: hypothetical protein AB7O65_01305 [Candidatus Korobacteraceae bacterium]